MLICKNPECNKEFTPSLLHGIRHSRQKYCSMKCQSRSDWIIKKIDYKWRLGKLLSAAKNRAKEKGIPFNIDKEYLIDLWESNKGRCLLTNQPFDLENWGTKGQVSPQAPSIDRIIPNLGYVKGNIRLITYHLNVALSDFGLEELTKLSNLINKRIC